MLESLLRKFDNYYRTSPITNIKDRSVTFIRDTKYFPTIYSDIYSEKDFWLIAPTTIKGLVNEFCEYYYPNAKVYYTDWPEFEFTIFHNEINKGIRHTPIIGKNCNIHETVIMEVDGLKLVHCPDGQKIQFKHTGNILIGDNVDIGPYSVIHRGTMGSTVINSGCKMGAKNNVGHNCNIGAGSVLAVGVIFNGGVTTGVNCWFSSGSMVKHYTTITDNVVIGMGSVVTKNIDKSGIYVGSPAKYLRDVEEGWNF
jgi:acetyltransferase-like isoleucine patch superfamily enzyme